MVKAALTATTGNHDLNCTDRDNSLIRCMAQSGGTALSRWPSDAVEWGGFENVSSRKHPGCYPTRLSNNLVCLKQPECW